MNPPLGGPILWPHNAPGYITWRGTIWGFEPEETHHSLCLITGPVELRAGSPIKAGLKTISKSVWVRGCRIWGQCGGERWDPCEGGRRASSGQKRRERVYIVRGKLPKKTFETTWSSQNWVYRVLGPNFGLKSKYEQINVYEQTPKWKVIGWIFLRASELEASILENDSRCCHTRVSRRSRGW